MIVKVLINTSVKTLNKVYDYKVKDNMMFNISIGKRVKVSFGRGKDRFVEGIIVKIEDDTYNPEFKMKYIDEILDEISYIDNIKLKLCKWMAYMYFCNVYDTLKLMLPPGTNNINSNKTLKAKQETVVNLNKDMNEILNEIEDGKIKSAKHIQLYKFLMDNEYVTVQDITEGLSISRGILSTVEKNGYITLEKVDIKTDSLLDLNVERTEKLIPTDEQQLAIDGIIELTKSDKHEQCLLFGVTGSGKTEVYLQVIEEVLKTNKTVIVLVPEISLTHQTLTRFVSRFGNIVSVLHSKMTISERKEEYRKIKVGDSKIVVGARSAVFAPLDNIGLIIIDEEHDSSYYSQTTPKYSTKEVAAYICSENNATLLLGSATPEVSTYYKTTNGKIKLFELKYRPNGAIMPEVIMVDRKIENLSNSSVISKRLKEEIIKNISNKEQTMIFMNRRGYSSYLTCMSCSYIFKCSNCDVAMTYHKKNNLLLCHYCSHAERNINQCPVCRSSDLKESSFGTQKIEEELTKQIPGVSILRMDRDTTILKDGHTKILEKFKNENVDVLIGTQMISKGHDIENVTLVGVLGTDSMLNMNDYLASEKAYSNISQVAGRSGRGLKHGRTVIETSDTANNVLNSAVNHDYLEFYNSEISFRKVFTYPPFSDLILLQLASINNNSVKLASDKLYDIMQNSDNMYKIFSPKSPYIERVNNKYRINILVKTNITNDVMKKIYENLRKYGLNKVKDVSLAITRNPNMI
ncbi:MAG: primosomal protein N' [Clostridia bacterium]|nr:primosomal protein N' [Clostridia bacterium]MDD4386983.1 primosomal protein N' [Clostridia bacterium]